MECSIQYHVTINSQLNDRNSIRYYIIHFIACYPTLMQLRFIFPVKQSYQENFRDFEDPF
jgi:hypothetical protein